MSKDKRDPNLTYLDDTPVEVPLKVRKAALEGDTFKRMVQEFSRMQAEAGNETLEEADDFDTGEDDEEFVSRYEMSEMQEEGRMDDASFRAKRGVFFPHKENELHDKNVRVDKDKRKEDDGDASNKDAKLKE